MENSGEVDISETTYRLVKDQFTCDFWGEGADKGYGDVIRKKIGLCENVRAYNWSA